jgi:hypothetical protein
VVFREDTTSLYPGKGIFVVRMVVLGSTPPIKGSRRQIHPEPCVEIRMRRAGDFKDDALSRFWLDVRLKHRQSQTLVPGPGELKGGRIAIDIADLDLSRF